MRLRNFYNLLKLNLSDFTGFSSRFSGKAINETVVENKAGKNRKKILAGSLFNIKSLLLKNALNC